MIDIESERDALSLDSEAYYSHLTVRNRGLIPSRMQDAIGKANLLIAGCGSIGGATVLPLVRTGYRNLILADVGSFELNNLNRQNASVKDLGSNKAQVLASRVKEVNPFASVEVSMDGVTAENVSSLLQEVDLIIDGVDVTTRSGLRAKMALHEEACRRNLPLITAWDMAGMLAVQYFDYRRISKPFRGEISAADVESLGIWEAILRIAPRRHIPAEMFDELRKGIHDPDYSVPQLAEAANQFGSLVTRMANIVVSGGQPKALVAIDVHRQCLSRLERFRYSASKPIAAARFVRSLGYKGSFRSFVPRSMWALTSQFSR